jgi:indolepyruvate ferredoxin oxidoreductase, beta subunit
MEITNVLFSGVGGQGILTSGRLLGLAALNAGLDVKMSEVHGMSQRGGNVDAHVRVGKVVPSPLIPKGGAHFLVSFEKLEALRYMEFLRPDGVVLVSDLEIHPLSSNLKETSYVPEIDKVLAQKAPRLLLLHALEEARGFGDVRMVNVLLLGALSVFMEIAPGHWEAAIRDRFSPKVQETCWKAFQRGAALARERAN